MLVTGTFPALFTRNPEVLGRTGLLVIWLGFWSILGGVEWLNPFNTKELRIACAYERLRIRFRSLYIMDSNSFTYLKSAIIALSTGFSIAGHCVKAIDRVES